jgi:CheY-like chemotaxis protein
MVENKNVKVLIVEDEEIICKTYADELSDSGFNVLVAGNGKEGLELALHEKPDIILLDILMPVMDGLSMMDQLRKDENYGKKVPIILLTNLSAGEEKIMQSIIKNEPAYYLIKSDWTLSQVIEKIKERLSRKI